MNKFFFVCAVAVIGCVWTGVANAQDKQAAVPHDAAHASLVCVDAPRPLEAGSGGMVQVCSVVYVASPVSR
jgi:hypothetical protein